MRQAAAACVVVLVLLSGCSAPEEGVREADAEKPRPDEFALRLRVLSAKADPRPIAGASLLLLATNTSANATTDAHGEARFALNPGTTIRITASHPDWVGGTSIRVRTGGTETFAQVLSNLVSGFVCLMSFGGACVFPEEIELPGMAGALNLYLAPPSQTLEFEAPMEAKAQPRGVSDPKSEGWAPVQIVFSDVPEVQRNLLVHVSQVDAVLSWTNAPPAAGDLGLGLGCDGFAPMVASPEGPDNSTAPVPGERSVAISWAADFDNDQPQNLGWFSAFDQPCEAFWAGPYVRTATTDLATVVRLDITYQEATLFPQVAV